MPPEPAVPEPSVPAATPELPNAPASNTNPSWSDWLNNGINDFFFNTKVNPDNENFKAIQAQNQAAGINVHPDRGTWEDAKNLAGIVSGGAAFVNGLEQATNTDNSALDRVMGAVSAGLSVASAVGSVAAAEGRMCGLASCFTAGTQVVVGEETIESACGTEIVQMQSFDGSNIAFAGLCIGFAVISVSINRKKKDRSMNSHHHTGQTVTSFDEGENPLPIVNDFTENSNSCEKTWSFLRPVLATILFSFAILCGYLALPTTKSVAVSTPTVTTQTETKLITKSIETVQVGERVLGKNPVLSEEDRKLFGIEPTQETHYEYFFALPKEDETITFITLLRPRNWLEQDDFVREFEVPIESGEMKRGLCVWLELPEMGTVGWAQLLSVNDEFEIKSGKGNVVTGRFAHLANNVIDLKIEGQEPIGCTDNHPFWSVDRQEYIDAGQLRDGERILLYSGETKRVEQKLARPGSEIVYNIEVFGEHVYHVGKDGILVHNTCLDLDLKGKIGRNKSIPPQAYRVLNGYAKTGTLPEKFYPVHKYHNDNGQLPRHGNYWSLDILREYPYQRGVRRIVIDLNSGQAWYTNNHYETFRRM